MDCGHHVAYTAIFLFGQPKEISAASTTMLRRAMEGEDVCHITAIHKNGLVGDMTQTCAIDYHAERLTVSVLCEKGTLKLSEYGLFVNDKRVCEGGPYIMAFSDVSNHFTKAIRSGTAPLSTLDDCRRCLELIQGAYQSSETKKFVTLSD